MLMLLLLWFCSGAEALEPPAPLMAPSRESHFLLTSSGDPVGDGGDCCMAAAPAGSRADRLAALTAPVTHGLGLLLDLVGEVTIPVLEFILQTFSELLGFRA